MVIRICIYLQTMLSLAEHGLPEHLYFCPNCPLNSNLSGKLNNKGYYAAQGIDGSGISINDMTNPGIYRFYVNPNTDNANYLGWTARTLLILYW